MSLTLYFLRHGETIYSETGAYCGEVDAELTPEGAQMAEAFAQAFQLGKFCSAIGARFWPKMVQTLGAISADNLFYNGGQYGHE